jgi:hypothetical protein
VSPENWENFDAAKNVGLFGTLWVAWEDVYYHPSMDPLWMKNNTSYGVGL